jgi:hypothetical protein
MFTVFSTARSENTVTFVYKIKTNAMYKGDLFLTVYPKAFKSTYINIDKNDRIPFYCALKSGEFTNDFFSRRLTFNSHDYAIYYDFKKLPSDIYTHKAYQTADKAFIVDQKEKKISYAVDQIPVLTFENIIIGFVRNKLSSFTHDMVLYEDTSKSLFRIYFDKNHNKQTKQLNTGPCSYHTYDCYRKNIGNQPPKKLFTLDVSNENIPIRIAAVSGRWELIIDEYLEGEVTPVDIQKYLVQIASDAWLNYYQIRSSQLKSPMRVKLSDVDGDRIIYDYEIQIAINNDIKNQYKYAAQFFQKVLFDNVYTVRDKYIVKNGQFFQVKVSKKEICDLYLRTNYDISSMSQAAFQMNGETIMIFKLLGADRAVDYSRLNKWMQKDQEGYILRVSEDDVFKQLYKESYNNVTYNNNVCVITGASYTKVGKMESLIQKELKYQLNTKKLFSRDRLWFISSKVKPLPVCR